MRFPETSRKQAEFSRMQVEMAGHEAVRSAEEVVGSAWMAALADAEEESAAAQRICAHMRDTAYEVLRAAEAEGNVGLIAAGRRELEASHRALAEIRERYELMRRFAGGQRRAWSAADRERTLGSIRDRERLAAAARAAGIDTGSQPESG